MKTPILNTRPQPHQSRWLITSATTMLLTALTLGSHSAYADETATTADKTHEQTSSQVVQTTKSSDSQVPLKASAAQQNTPIKNASATDTTVVTSDATGSTTKPMTSDTTDTSMTTGAHEESINKADDSTDKPSDNTAASTDNHSKSESKQTAPSAATSTTTTNGATPSTNSDNRQTTANSTAKSVTTSQTDTAQKATTARTTRLMSPKAQSTTQENINDWMPNTRLQQEVLRQLRAQNPDRTWNAASDITKDDMLLLTTYYGKDTYIDGKTSYSLEGLQYATNLTTVWLNNNLNAPSGSYYSDVTDISQLADLQKLQVVNIQQNRITDISPLANLKNLTEVDAAYNHISDFSPLKGFKNLKGTFSNQFITLPPAYISEQNNTATLDIDCYLPDGTKAQLKPNGGVGETVFYKNDQLYVRWYFNGAGGGNYDNDGHIYYTNMKPQQPGLSDPTFNGTTVIPMDDYYFMTAASDGNNFVVVRPYVLAATAAPVTVKYLDALTGESLVANDLTLTGIVGQPYSTQRIDDELPNYRFTNIVGSATGTFTADSQTVTYYYTRKDAGDITIHMVDTEGNLLHDAQVLPGKNNLGNAYNLEAPTFANFNLQSTNGNVSGVFTTDPQAVTFIYVRLDAGDITVKYQDKNGQQLQAGQTLSGAQSLGKSYTTQPVNIDNYTVVTPPANATGTFTAQAQTVIYVYARRDAGQIVVKYQDLSGNQLAADKILDGKEQLGAAYKTEAASISNFRLVSKPANAEGIFSADTQTVIYQYARLNAGHITVKYQDANGNTLAPNEVLSGDNQLGLPYQTSAKVIENYRLVQAPANASGQFSDQAQTVIYVYTRADAGDITIQYLDEAGKQLAANSILTGQGQLGKPYETSPLNINGYTVKSTQGNTAGTFTTQPQRIVYIYERTAGKNVTAKYQDANGQTIHPDVVHSGYLGDNYTTEQLDIDGYTFKSVQGEVTGTFGTAAKTVTYVYERTAGKNVTAKYQDVNGNTIHPDVVHSGYLGDNYTTEQLVIDGYTFKSVQGEVTGTFGTAAKTVTYVYERTTGKNVTAKYQDANGQTIHPDVVHSGYLGDKYATEQLDINGYTFKTVQGEVSGTFGTAAKTVTYVYERTAGKNVTAKYQDENGQTIHPDVVHSGYLSDKYTTEQLAIDGYTFKTVQGEVSGTFGTAAKTVTYVYSKNAPTIPDAKGTVTVHHISKDGISLADPIVLSGKTGATYQTQPLTLDNYELIGQPSNATGQFTTGDVIVTYIYQLTKTDGADDIIDPEEPEKPTEPTKPVQPTTPETPRQPGTTGGRPDTIKPAKPVTQAKASVKPATAQVQLIKTTKVTRSSKTQSTQLPQTDEQERRWVSILGLLLSVIALGFYGKHREP